VALARGPSLVGIGGTPRAPVAERTAALDSRSGLADRANVDFTVSGPEFWVTAPQAPAIYHRTP
jgi:hypothetical protein